MFYVYSFRSVIKRLDQYDEFYLAFKSVISDLMETLGIALKNFFIYFSFLMSKYASLHAGQAEFWA